MRPPADSVHRQLEPAAPRWIVLPRYVPHSPPILSYTSKAQTLMRLIESAFNFNIHGRTGFNLLADLVSGCDCYEFAYSDLDDAARTFKALSQSPDKV
jgi:hypothetical protein